MNVRKWICKNVARKGTWLYKALDCRRYEPPVPPPEPPVKTVVVCMETGLRAVHDCPTRLVPAEEAPTYYCHVHRRRTSGVPFMVMDYVDLQCKVHRFDNETLDAFCRKVGEAGVDYVRVFYTGWDDGHGVRMPYELAGTKYDLDQFNGGYFDNLRRLAAALGKYEVGLWVDMADQCSVGEPWDVWANNVNGVRGWWDESDRAFGHWKTAVNVLFDIANYPLIGLGNELSHPQGEDMVGEGSCRWPISWGLPRAEFIRWQGPLRLITHSGGGNTGHKLTGCLEYYYSLNCITQILHGYGLVEHMDYPNGGVWQDAYRGKDRPFGYSDDGVGTNPWNMVPLGKRGLPDANSYAYPANNEERVKTVRAFEEMSPGNLKIVAFLPREISLNESPLNIAPTSLSIYDEVARGVYGVSIKRTF